MRICLIGAGDIDYHFKEILKLNEEELKKEIKAIAKAISKEEIVLLPDRGICFEVAKEMRKISNNEIIGTVPFSDKDFGIKHLETYIHAKIDNKKIFTSFIDTSDWYKQDLKIGLFGDAILLLGITLGSLGELSYAYYLYKLAGAYKKEVKIKIEKIHKEAKDHIENSDTLRSKIYGIDEVKKIVS